MKKQLLILGLLALTIHTATAAVTYDIDVRGDDADVTTTFQLYSEQKVNYWDPVSWKLPEGSQVENIRDSRGQITEYEIEGNTIIFSTNEGEARNSETVEIQYTIPSAIKTWKDDIHILDLQLSGFDDTKPDFDEEQTSATVSVPDPVLGTKENHGFRSSFKNRQVNLSGEGPLNLKVVYTPLEGEYDHFILVGEQANLTRADNAYPILNKITGTTVDFRKFAVIILPNTEYQQKMQAWSAGTYRAGGIIFIREGEVDKNSFTATLLHEAMHGFNQKPLSWVRGDFAMFDEGMGKFVEYLVNAKLEVHQSQIFGEEETWTAPCTDQPGRTCQYTLPPRGTPEHLWEYYQQDLNIMDSWNPSQGGQLFSDLSRRSFGYAFSELLIRDYVKRNGPDSLHNIYRQFKQEDQAVETASAYYQYLQQTLGTDLQPCRSNTQSQLENCLEDINQFVPDTPDSVAINGQQEEIKFTPIKVPDTPDQGINYSQIDITPRGTVNFFTGFLQWIGDGIANFFSSIAQLFS